MKKFFCLLLVTIFLSQPSTLAQATASNRNNLINQTTIQEEKTTCTATLEDSFVESDIIVSLTKSASSANILYNADDFSEMFGIEIVSAEAIVHIDKSDTTALVNWDNYRQIFKLEIPQKGKQAVLDTIEIVEQHIHVASASPDFIVECDFVEENSETTQRNTDTAIENEQTHATNDEYIEELYAIELMEVPTAWELCTGASELRVGIIDTGIDSAHPDLIHNLNISAGKKFLPNSEIAWVDPVGHGTHVAGIIGATANNGIGITGLCQSIDLISLRALSRTVREDGSFGGSWQISHVASAVGYAAEHNISVLNFSAGVLLEAENLLAYAELYNAIALYGGIFVCSAGNESKDTDLFPHYPSTFDLPNVISVAATNDYDGLESFSNYGCTTVDIAAPGKDILSTVPVSLCTGNLHDKIGGIHIADGYHKMSGTSMAAPQVAGVAALLLSYYPDLTAAELKSYILNSVDVLDYDIDGLVGKVATGGRLNAANALRLANDYQGIMDDRFVTGDFNGDGKDDAACFAAFNNGTHSEIRVSLSNGTSAQPWDIWFQSTAFNAFKTTNRMVAGDFNGDGKDDIAVMYDYSYEESGKSKIFVFLSTGSAFGSAPQTWFSTGGFPASKVADRFVAGDFNGDGKDDIAALFDYSFQAAGRSKMFVFKSTGSSFGSWPQTWFSSDDFTASKVTGRFVAGDFNEDGKDDIAAMFDRSAEESGKCTIYVFPSTGSSFSSAPQDWFTNGGFPSSKVTNRFTAGDFDGDGDDDIGVMFDYSFQATGNSKIFVFKSSGSSFGSWPQTWFNTTAFPANKVTSRFAAGDLTGDGKADIAALYNYITDSELLSTEFVFKSTGSSFGSWPQTWIATPSVTAATANVLEDDEYYQLHSTMTEAER